MTSSLRRKRPTTVAPNTPARMAASLFGLGLLLTGSQAPAQDVPQSGTEPARILHFTKPANTIKFDVPEKRPSVTQDPALSTPVAPPPPPSFVFPARPLSLAP